MESYAARNLEKALTLHSISTNVFSKKLDNKVRELDYTGSGIPPFWKPEIVTPKSINSRFDDLSQLVAIFCSSST